MAGRADYLDALAERLLLIARAGLDPSRTGHPLPTRSYVSHGTPAVPLCSDGTGQLTVHLDHIDYRGLLPTKQTPSSHRMAPVADFRIQLWRCVPNVNDAGQSPDSTAEGEMSFGLAVDGWCLATFVGHQMNTTDLLPGSNVGGVQATTSRALPRQGASAGWELGLSIGLNDPGPPEVGS